MSEFINRDEEALAELRRQIERMEALEESCPDSKASKSQE
jgi:hypothetical protein